MSRLLAALVLVAGVGVVSGAPLPARAAAGANSIAAPIVRVLLMESEQPVRVHAGASGVTTLAPDGAGLRADGRPVGPVWRLEAGEGRALRVGGWRVRGMLEVSRTAKGLRVVNHVGLEDYVSGTLGREVYPGWETEMLKAQAVVARSYALYRRARGAGAAAFDVEGTTAGQVYGGADAETPRLRAAVTATRGEILVYQGAPIFAAYHSSSGGRTASAAEVWGRPVPYLISQSVENEEDSPDTYWRA